MHLLVTMPDPGREEQGCQAFHIANILHIPENTRLNFIIGVKKCISGTFSRTACSKIVLVGVVYLSREALSP